ncbi:MAG: hypothetical protein V3R84_07715 [Acidimicrobiia bacterium]
MPWTSTFIDELEQDRLTPFYVLEAVEIPIQDPFPTSSPALGFSSLHGEANNTIMREGSSVSPGLLRLRTWGYSAGGVVVAVTNASDARRVARRGQAVRLLVGFTPDRAEMETVALGTVTNITRVGGQCRIEIRDLLGALTSRITTNGAHGALFHDQLQTTLAQLFVPGLPGASMTVVSGALLRPSPDGLYYVKVTGNGGEDFVMSATGLTVATNTLTGVSAAALFGTTEDTASPGNACVEVIVIDDHPIRAAKAILVSTGLGTNGFLDGLPESCGFGIPAEHVAESDMEAFIDLTDLVGHSDNWQLVLDQPIANPKGFLDGWLASGGYFLAMHQGAITCRGIVDAVPANDTPYTFDLTDGHIGKIDRYETWDSRNPVEYAEIRVFRNDGVQVSAETGDTENIPARDRIDIAMAGVYSDTTDAAFIGQLVRLRLQRWHFESPEVLFLTLRGWSAAKVSPGSLVRLEIGILKDRDGYVWEKRRALVMQCAPDWFGASTRMVIAVLPADILTVVTATA